MAAMQNNMLIDVLKNLGLSETEVKVYTALLPLGTTPASTVGMRLNMPRPTAKYTCEQLQKKGLVTAFVKNSTFLYTAKEPEALHSILATERKQIEKKGNELEKVMGELKQLFNTEVQLPKVQFFEGAENINKVLEDALAEDQPLYGCLYIDETVHPTVLEYVEKVYLPERKRKQSPTRSLFNDNPLTQDYRKHDADMNRISLLVPTDQFPFEICFHIYGKKVAFYSYRSEDLTGIIIEHPLIHNMQFSLFKMAWNFARSLKQNEAYKDVSLD
jgi:sugar-specific transcriptional regulator TrmB